MHVKYVVFIFTLSENVYNILTAFLPNVVEMLFSSLQQFTSNTVTNLWTNLKHKAYSKHIGAPQGSVLVPFLFLFLWCYEYFCDVLSFCNIFYQKDFNLVLTIDWFYQKNMMRKWEKMFSWVRIRMMRKINWQKLIKFNYQEIVRTLGINNWWS